MKAAFVNPGGPKYPDGSKLARYGITRLYWQSNDPQVDGKFLDEMRKYCEVGIMRDPSWDSLSGNALALEFDANLRELGSDNKQCAVLADVEYHSAEFLSAFLFAWRKLRPSRITAWTMEPWQFGDPREGGWVTDALVAQINADTNLQVIPQHYLGSPRMYPTAQDQVMLQAARRGIRTDRLRGFYDAARQPLPDRWDGILYSFGDLA